MMEETKEESTAKSTNQVKEIVAESNLIKARFFKKNKVFIFIKTIKGRLYQGYISKIEDDYILIDDIYSGQTIVTVVEIDTFEKHRDPEDIQRRKKSLDQQKEDYGVREKSFYQS